MLEILARSIISSHSLSTVLLSQWPKEQTPDITNSLHTKYSVFYKIEFTIYLVFYLPPPPIFAAVRPISLCLYFAFPLRDLNLYLGSLPPYRKIKCLRPRSIGRLPDCLLLYKSSVPLDLSAYLRPRLVCFISLLLFLSFTLFSKSPGLRVPRIPTESLTNTCKKPTLYKRLSTF